MNSASLWELRKKYLKFFLQCLDNFSRQRLALTFERGLSITPSTQDGGLIYANYDKLKAWGDPRNECRVVVVVKYFCCPETKYDCNDKILTYGPNNNVYTDQIRPFIHMYLRRTILSGPKPIKIFEAIFCSNFFFFFYRQDFLNWP